jgi:hypothetical protein
LHHEHELLFRDIRRPWLFNDQTAPYYGSIELLLNCFQPRHRR